MNMQRFSAGADDSTITTQAIVDLTDANVPLAAETIRETELALRRESAEDEANTPSRQDIGEAVEAATIFG